MDFPTREFYLGDGLYIRIEVDGSFRLRAPREDGDHLVWLDGSTLETLVEWTDRMKGELRRARAEAAARAAKNP